MATGNSLNTTGMAVIVVGWVATTVVVEVVLYDDG